ncbi:aminopeptidase N [Leifsonia sp. AK011]|uniref:M1 family metallopeptidase n=1 Tax=Leifsonia sp. AK011 TaxID=2723075 RepID=UPI0015CE3316|nr:M1 family metallopeptidase [Leifsonia sp. AK011]NYF11058.1 aminopeptidase N [Leifsonia sp. AK011]
MTDCVLPNTGVDFLPLALGLTALGLGLLVAGILLWRQRRRGLLLLILPLALVVSLGVAPAQPASAVDCPPGTIPAVEFTPGAAGIGDDYYPLDGNGGYDVQDYDLQLAYDPESRVLSGTAVITAVATQNLSRFNLDFDTRDTDLSDAIVVSDVVVNNSPATWTLETTQISIETGQPQLPDSVDGDATPPRTELVVTPAAGIPTGSTITTEVAYSGIPIPLDDVFGPGGVLPTGDGAVIIGEPRVAATWFPSNDHPLDKATFTIEMTVPEGTESIANGRLESETTSGGVTTRVWVMDEPMATYLATATTGEYDETVTTAPDGITYYNAIDPDLFSVEADGGGAFVGDVATDVFDSEPEVIAFLEDFFGPYPFSEAGGIAVGEIAPGEDLPYALENQTRPIYPAWAFPADADPATVVHELAHQWYGDSVTLSRWGDMWLNEGFATYAEWLWAEDDGGLTAQQQFDAYYINPPGNNAAFWAATPGEPGPAGLFDTPVYYRSAMALQALRMEVGDPTFFAIIEGWATENAGGNVTTQQFVDYASSVADQDLSGLFDAWLFTPEQPAL